MHGHALGRSCLLNVSEWLEITTHEWNWIPRFPRLVLKSGSLCFLHIAAADVKKGNTAKNNLEHHGATADKAASRAQKPWRVADVRFHDTRLDSRG